jgi:hypothetical protein
MTIRTQTEPSLVQRPTISFEVNAFEAALWQKGYSVLHEEARVCPCRSRDSGSSLPNCQNCRGFGYIFMNPIETKAIITNINQNPKFMEWSIENAGTVMASFMFDNKLADYDRITFSDVIIRWSENLKVRIIDGQSFVFLTYLPDEILDIFCFQSSSTALIKLNTTEYFISAENPYILLLDFTPPTNFNGTITVTYNCHPAYHVIDLPHSLRASTAVNTSGQVEKIDLPVQAVLRRAHVVLGLSDFSGGVTTIDNSYK